MRLSQYIGTKSSSQVKHYLNNVYEDKITKVEETPDQKVNIQPETGEDQFSYSMSELIEDAQVNFLY